jgi:hypothetical protein
MQIAMSCALALMSWREFKFLHGDFTGSGFVWLPSDQTDNVPETILLRNQLAENLRPEALFSLSGSELTGPPRFSYNIYDGVIAHMLLLLLLAGLS